MALVFRYQDPADQVVGERIHSDEEALIDPAMRTTHFSAAVSLKPPCRFVDEVLIGNYRDEAKRDENKAEYLAFIEASARPSGRAATRFEREAWCDIVYGEQATIAKFFGGSPSGSLPKDLEFGKVRFDWIPADGYVEVIVSINKGLRTQEFERSCRELDESLCTAWEQVVLMGHGVEDVYVEEPSPPTVFLCHSTKDKHFVRRLDEALKSQNILTWFDESEILVGDDFVKSMEDGLARSGHVVVVLSPNFVNGGPWAKVELRTALTRQVQEGRVVVLPVLYRDCEMPQLLRSKVYADFRKSFDHGIHHLVRSIRDNRLRSD